MKKKSSLYFTLGTLCFQVLHKYLIHLKLICGRGVRPGSSFILLYVNIQLSQHHLLKKLTFLFLVPFQILVSLLGFILELLILLHWSIHQFLCHYHTVVFFELPSHCLDDLNIIIDIQRLLFLFCSMNSQVDIIEIKIYVMR